MTLNDLWARFKVIYFLNAAKMAKYSLVMTYYLVMYILEYEEEEEWLQRHVEWLDALYLLSLRIHAMVHLLTYFLTYP